MAHLPTRPSLRQKPEETNGTNKRIMELAETHEVISVGHGYLVVAERSMQMASPTVSGSLSQAGTTRGGLFASWLMEDYNPVLRGRYGIKKYDEMKRSDSSVRKSLRLLKTPVQAGRWYMQPASDSAMDKAIAERVWKNFQEELSTTWQMVVSEALFMVDYGYYVFEKVYERKSDGKTLLKKLAPIHPIDIQEWEWDANGGPNGFYMDKPGNVGGRVWIGIEDVMVFTYDREAANILGMSALRSAYKNWYMKDVLYKIDAMQKERHGIGIPVIKLPPGFDADDRALADQLGSNLRANERAHVTLPPLWELEFLKLEGRPVDALKSAEHHDAMIMSNVMGDFIGGRSTSANSGAENQWNVFQKANAFLADIIKDVFNKWLIPEMVDMNWRVKNYPQLKVRRIGDTTDWRTISFALRNFTGAGMLVPDDELEDWIREEMDLPDKDPDTAREQPTPQGPGGGGEARVGPPRQAKPSAKPPAGNAGTDRSGG